MFQQRELGSRFVWSGSLVDTPILILRSIAKTDKKLSLQADTSHGQGYEGSKKKENFPLNMINKDGKRGNPNSREQGDGKRGLLFHVGQDSKKGAILFKASNKKGEDKGYEGKGKRKPYKLEFLTGLSEDYDFNQVFQRDKSSDVMAPMKASLIQDPEVGRGLKEYFALFDFGLLQDTIIPSSCI
ncbi:unnamed protein product [Lepeophtheirus salmonis]|uniref:(salmon louse) hypothetical protein n=1 Tax=Lepeophtheirus salmonis TaxID=72036 RepID=A0A7R8GZR6_LEPSM|nr:unnamed protein product [Lepeophtheirus salmonis]CAF2756681.1 unnamed protein product [Lepeophtheirus salmonis]